MANCGQVFPRVIGFDTIMELIELFEFVEFVAAHIIKECATVQ